MRKILIVIFFVICPIMSYSQVNLTEAQVDSIKIVNSVDTIENQQSGLEKDDIRGDFFGFSFGDDKTKVMSCLKENGLYCYEDESNLSTSDIFFCGKSFSYSKEKFVNNKLYEIDFVNGFISLVSARKLYYQIKNELISNYGSSNDMKDGCAFYGANNCCSITIDYGESKGGNNYYYVGLDYWNKDLYNEYDKNNKL